MKQWRRRIAICLLVLLILYLAPATYLSATVYAIARSSFHNYGSNNPYPEVVSDEIYAQISYRSRHLLNRIDTVVKEKETMSFPLTRLGFGTAKVVYWYTYEAFFEDGDACGSWNIPICLTLALQDGKWVVTDFYEHP